MTPGNLVDFYRHFAGTWCFQGQGVVRNVLTDLPKYTILKTPEENNLRIHRHDNFRSYKVVNDLQKKRRNNKNKKPCKKFLINLSEIGSTGTI